MCQGFAGLLLIAQRPFKPGDYVIITGDKIKVEGTVEAIDSRLVYLREEVSSPQSVTVRHIMIPTSIVYNSVITLTESVLPREDTAEPAASGIAAKPSGHLG